MTKCTEDFLGTYTGKKFHFLDPAPDEICIEDIAQALSMNCRYNGHVSKFYSVAEHSVIIAETVYTENWDREEALAALLHDASEAYLCDIPRPLKSYLTNYMEMEAKIEEAIQSRFNISPMSGLVKEYDYNIVADEAGQLFLEVPDWVSNYDELGITTRCWSPEKAKEEFLEMFYNFYTGE